MTRVFAGLVLTTILLVLSTPAAGQDPSAAKVCALLTPAEIQAALDSKVEVGAGVASPIPGTPGSLACKYTWGSGGNVSSGRSYLNVIVTEVSKQFPGMKVADVKRGLLGAASGGDPNVVVVPGIGDGTLFESHDEIRIQTTSLVKDYMLQITFESEHARAKKDQFIGLARMAAVRIQG